ncbi:MAG: hypothetical protein R3E79_57425 [Caldilineaceae bacterium]
MAVVPVNWRNLCRAGHWLMVGLWILLAAGCGIQSDAVRPVEEEQIENVVTDYYVRNTSIPDYDVTIEAVEEEWARVSIAPSGVETEQPDIVYLQNQAETLIEAPTAVITTALGNTARVATESGWVIVVGPQANFNDEELDAAGVPPFIRP